MRTLLLAFLLAACGGDPAPSPTGADMTVPTDAGVTIEAGETATACTALSPDGGCPLDAAAPGN